MSVNEYRLWLSSVIKRQEIFEDIDWSIPNHIWHFGFDFDGNVVKIEPWKVVLSY